MSEKIQEFLEIPQEFIRDGNQVRIFYPCNPNKPLSSPPHSFSSGVQNPLKKVFALCLNMDTC
jgi:hypothetical protein